ncbi:unnamed protein product, partial [Iphiclides podalirius]
MLLPKIPKIREYLGKYSDKELFLHRAAEVLRNGLQPPVAVDRRLGAPAWGLAKAPRMPDGSKHRVAAVVPRRPAGRDTATRGRFACERGARAVPQNCPTPQASANELRALLTVRLALNDPLKFRQVMYSSRR